MILAGVGIVVAAFAFVVAALGMVAWFLNYRAQMKEIITAADTQEDSKRDDGESCEDSDDD